MGTKYGEYIMAHNEYLDTSMKITVTGLHHDLFQTRLQYPEGSNQWHTIYDKLLFEHFQPFCAIEETPYSDSNGTWFSITKKELRFETVEFLHMIFLKCCASEPAFLKDTDNSDTFHRGIIINTPLFGHTNDPFRSYGTTINLSAQNPHASANTSLIQNNSQHRNNLIQNFQQETHQKPYSYIKSYNEPTTSYDNNSRQPHMQRTTPLIDASIVQVPAWHHTNPAALATP
jgi:hypothetical protein